MHAPREADVATQIVQLSSHAADRRHIHMFVFEDSARLNMTELPASVHVMTSTAPDQMHALASACDILLLISDVTDKDSVVVTAMASGLPVVAARIFSRSIDPLLEGASVLVDVSLASTPADQFARAMWSALDSLLADPSRMQTLGRTAVSNARMHSQTAVGECIMRAVCLAQSRVQSRATPTVAVSRALETMRQHNVVAALEHQSSAIWSDLKDAHQQQVC